MRWDRPAAGREPAAAALLGWLADPQAPGLCLVSGSAESGKSQLLAWLVHHGSRPGTPPERTVHAVTPAAGLGVRGIVWSLAEQLGVVARGPAELVAALKRDERPTVIVLPDLHEGDGSGLVLALARLPHVRLIVEARSGGVVHQVLAGGGCAELDLDLEQWRDDERFAQWQASRPESEVRDGSPSGHVVVDLSDPVAVCAADPWQVTTAYEADDSRDHGGLRAAWLRAGQSVCAEQSPASRALVLLSVLGDGADPRLRPALVELAAGAGWGVAWSRVCGDVVPPWPGAVTSLAVGAGPLSGCLVLAGPGGVVKSVHVADASAHGRLLLEAGEVADVAVLAEGTALLLDTSGRIHVDSKWTVRAAGSGLAGLLDDSPTDADRLLQAVRSQAGTALAFAAGAGLGIVAVGSAAGGVQTFGEVEDAVDLHDGPVTSLAAISVPVDSQTSVHLVYSGGADGAVRVWSPGHYPMPEPLVQRPGPLVSLSAAVTHDGPRLVAVWGDGVVRYIHVDTGEQRVFRPGPPVRSVALDGAGRVFVGMDEAVACLTPVAVQGEKSDT
ncbi:hypothetical protein ACFCZ6_32465 [Streptomyces hydrogenans]|uniref:hypothetical protein n=1 Tax=Streptomyces hydrogenans TaxID=1873719 RepID=UPI0035D64619